MFTTAGILAFLLFGRVGGMSALAAGLAALAVGYHYSLHGLLLSPVDAVAFFASPATWVSAGLTVILITCIVILFTEYLLNALAREIADASCKNDALASQSLELKRFKLAIECSNQGVFISDASKHDRPITYVNAAFSRITGYSPDEAIGRNPAFLSGKDLDQPARKLIIEAHLKGVPCEAMLRAYCKGGSLLWLEVKMAPVYDETGKLVSFINTLNDVTERVLSEETLRESQKLEAIGHLAGGLAHDFNNFLGVAIGNLDLASERLPQERHIETALAATLVFGNFRNSTHRDGTATCAVRIHNSATTNNVCTCWEIRTSNPLEQRFEKFFACCLWVF